MLERTLDKPLYQQLADALSNDIRSGIYPVGHRVPSVRKMSGLRGVSISTVSQAYGWLEDQGWLLARPQSGYYVRSSHAGMDQANVIRMPVSSPEAIPSAVTKSELISDVLDQLNHPGRINLGATIPHASLMPQRQLQQHIQKVSRYQLSEVLAYQFSPGHIGLRQQLAIRMRDASVFCDADDIVISHGCVDALTLCLRASTHPGDLIAVESPCYYGFLQLAELLGLKVLEIPTDPATGVSLEALELALSQWPIKLLLLTARFSNPHGAVMPVARQKQLVAMARRYDIDLLEDDIYGELSHLTQSASHKHGSGQVTAITGLDGACTALKAWDTDGRVMYCSSFSKTLSAGLRIGWCIPGRHFDGVVRQQIFTTFSACSLSQETIHSYLQQGHYDRHLRKLRQTISSNRVRFQNALQQFFPPQTLISQPLGGYCLWIQLPDGVSSGLLFHLAREQSISIVPGSLFSNSERFEQYLRLNIARPWDDTVIQALETLGRLVTQLMQKV
ncbi:MULTISPECIES: PLP-dependent aminotransferase family protein [unclassified Oceanobacter]|uniref:aminotransferase-like domain-containing protein n=2 Tax=Gammaproteobacteria TaxID=1236 RepID=UPI002737150D|nr:MULTISPECIES: PLP-dependent aminotransferase family protein [unclassified Oceanobacter]MDP2609681.1 PLP-dependent aminotransferase family protein [Oceanobacter sp. 1_MG-2023]MDP2613399.1 PLP-dependent aminotransferase family protein [Oceanobacter sp. 2_MG-2023]